MPATESYFFFFFNDTATTEIYTLSLHDALPICGTLTLGVTNQTFPAGALFGDHPVTGEFVNIGVTDTGTGIDPADRKSTRLNSSHSQISYAVFCLKKKKKYFVTHCRRAREIPQG